MTPATVGSTVGRICRRRPSWAVASGHESGLTCRHPTSDVGSPDPSARSRRGVRLEVTTAIPGDIPPSTIGTGPSGPGPVRLRPLDILILSAWCGLAGGLLEVAARIVGKGLFASNHLQMMSRHFVWLVPLSDLVLFVVLGFFLALLAAIWRRFGRWLGPRLVIAMALLPALVLLLPWIHESAWFLFASGAAVRLAPAVERRATGLRRRLLVTFPALLSVVVALAGWRVGGQWLAERREAARPIPSGHPPNVILVTLDTVGADHLSLHGYKRQTSPVLEALAKSGIRFDEARSAAPWTLPSHASMFTGRWHHELNVDWMTPLDGTAPTLAEYLGEHGYATAGFVANTMSCSYDTGLGRGFTRYEDYPLVYALPFRTAWLVDQSFRVLSDVGLFVGRHFDVGPFRPLHESWLTPYISDWKRKDAASVSRAFLDWLSRRPQPDRPFFAFLNYYDAHAPYVLPAGAPYRFGMKPREAQHFIFLMEYWEYVDKLGLRPSYLELGRDCYDSCVAFLDEQLGALIVDLFRLRVLENTWLIVTADHGEGMGEHDLYGHGESVYRPEIHVPLLILPPSNRRPPSGRVVRETVSLRDLPATIVDVTGQAGDSRFPGRSLASLWGDPSGRRESTDRPVLSELPSPDPSNPNYGRSPAWHGPLVSLAEGDLVYIRNRGDGREELYNERSDPGEEHDLSREEAMKPSLERLRRRLDELVGPSSPREPAGSGRTQVTQAPSGTTAGRAPSRPASGGGDLPRGGIP